MNKRKFFATCTLVAFGATMMPAMGFAAAPVSSSVDPAIDQFWDSSTGLANKAGEGIVVKFAGDEETYLTNDPIVNVEVYDRDGRGAKLIEDATDKFTVSAPKNAVASTSGGEITLTAKEGVTLVPGFYVVKVADKDNPTTNNEEVTFSARLTSPTVSVPSSVSAGNWTNGGKLGIITVATTGVGGTHKSVYDLGTSYAKVKKGDVPILKLPTGTNTGDISADLLTSGHVYAIYGDEEKASVDAYPTIVFEYDDMLVKNINDTVKAAEDQVNGDLDNLKDAVSIEISADKDFNTATDFLKTGASLSGSDKLFVAKGFDSNGVHVVNVDTYEDGTFTTINNVVYAEIKNMVAAGELNGKITVVIQNTDTKKISAEKEIDITLTDVKTSSEKMAVYAEEMGLSNYEAGTRFLDDDTATLEITTTGEVLTLPDNVTIDPLSYELSKYLKSANGKLTLETMPTEDVPGTIVLNFGNGSLTGADTGKITVSLTIKTAGSEDPAITAAIEATNDAIDEFIAAYEEGKGTTGASGATITDAEWRTIQAAYAKVLAAYMNYLALINA